LVIAADCEVTVDNAIALLCALLGSTWSVDIHADGLQHDDGLHLAEALKTAAAQRSWTLPSRTREPATRPTAMPQKFVW